MVGAPFESRRSYLVPVVAEKSVKHTFTLCGLDEGESHILGGNLLPVNIGLIMRYINTVQFVAIQSLRFILTASCEQHNQGYVQEIFHNRGRRPYQHGQSFILKI